MAQEEGRDPDHDRSRESEAPSRYDLDQELVLEPDLDLEPPRPWPSFTVAWGLPAALVLIGVLAAGLVSFRTGAVLLSVGLGLATMLRLLLDDAGAGWLVIRSRRTDVGVTGLLAVLVLVLALIVPPSG